MGQGLGGGGQRRRKWETSVIPSTIRKTVRATKGYNYLQKDDEWDLQVKIRSAAMCYRC